MEWPGKISLYVFPSFELCPSALRAPFRLMCRFLTPLHLVAQFREYLEAHGWDTSQMGILPDSAESWVEPTSDGSLQEKEKEAISA